MNILITGVGGPTPRSFAIALKKYSKYRSARLIGTDINNLSIGLYQNDLFNKSLIIPRATSSEYWEYVDKIVSEYKIDVAVVLPEAEVLQWSKRKESGLPCPALVPDYKLTAALLDKAEMTRMLKDLGIVPKSVEFQVDQTDFSNVFDELEFPFWVRSTSGSSGLGSLKVDSKESLAQWIAINIGVDKFLASEYLPGRNLACKLLYWEGDLLRAACGERVNYIMSKVAPSGITGNTSFGRLLNEPHLVDIASKAMDYLFEKFGAKKHGFFTVDLKEDNNGKPLITEINVRHVAFTQCFAAAGANFAEDTISLLVNEPIEKKFRIYDFEKDLIFLRDVDSLPILMKERDLLGQWSINYHLE